MISRTSMVLISASLVMVNSACREDTGAPGDRGVQQPLHFERLLYAVGAGSYEALALALASGAGTVVVSVFDADSFLPDGVEGRVDVQYLVCDGKVSEVVFDTDDFNLMQAIERWVKQNGRLLKERAAGDVPAGHSYLFAAGAGVPPFKADVGPRAEGFAGVFSLSGGVAESKRAARPTRRVAGIPLYLGAAPAGLARHMQADRMRPGSIILGQVPLEDGEGRKVRWQMISLFCGRDRGFVGSVAAQVVGDITEADRLEENVDRIYEAIAARGGKHDALKSPGKVLEMVMTMPRTGVRCRVELKWWAVPSYGLLAFEAGAME